ncbi:hypothetical protein CANARDRAFT_75518 [[Candida] arabinofermentans NRRL YB-2248]|uniref:Uncharacterized protein n=1 Tax=[Candida] arabinofermentans NRRL YB-2248 TaxID=983967 RepID=A0A1E4SWB5_9ASCO|nr:hypothetical protein CANARDRAFT_75518 [[Candida] arabinofermentans NRRL YB-2248]
MLFSTAKRSISLKCLTPKLLRGVSLQIGFTTSRLFSSSIQYQTENLNHFQNQQQLEDEKFIQFQKAQARKKKWTTIILSTVTGIVGSSIILYLWQPWNPFSTEVSRPLRKALWAESDKEDDYMKALKYYQEALKKCKEEGMDDLDPRYTGIVLKVAQMYEKLEMFDKEVDVYTKLSDFLFGKLINGEVEEEAIDRNIQRDLQVMTRVVELLNRDNDQRYVPELWDRMRFAESRINEKWGFLMKSKDESQFDVFEVLNLNDWSSRKTFIQKHLTDKAHEFWNQWFIELPYFMEDLIAAKDLYATLMISRRPELSISLLQSNILWMKLADRQPIFLGTEIQNLATAYYYKNQNHQLNINRLNNRMTQKEILENEDEITSLKALLKSEEQNRYESLRMSELIYLSIVNSFEEKAQTSSDMKLQSVVAMSLYSLGAIYYDKKDYSNCTKFLASAREKALDYAMVQVVDKIDNLVFSLEKKLSEENNS